MYVYNKFYNKKHILETVVVAIIIYFPHNALTCPLWCFNVESTVSSTCLGFVSPGAMWSTNSLRRFECIILSVYSYIRDLINVKNV